MADEVPSIIQRYLLDPNREFEARVRQIESILERLEQRGAKVASSLNSLKIGGTGAVDAEKAVETIITAVESLEDTVSTVSRTIDASFERLGTNIRQSLVAALNAGSQQAQVLENQIRSSIGLVDQELGALDTATTAGGQIRGRGPSRIDEQRIADESRLDAERLRSAEQEETIRDRIIQNEITAQSRLDAERLRTLEQEAAARDRIDQQAIADQSRLDAERARALEQQERIQGRIDAQLIRTSQLRQRAQAALAGVGPGATQAQIQAAQQLQQALQRLTTAQNNFTAAQTQGVRSQQVATAQLRVAIQNTTQATTALTRANQPATQSIQGLHQAMLAILGTSRFLPGSLGSAASGIGLLIGTASSGPAILLAVAGAALAAGAGFLEMGRQFNKSLVELDATAKGLGLTTVEAKAFQTVLAQSGGSIENFAVGIKKINEAITNIGPEAAETRALLEAIGISVTPTTKASEVILKLAKSVETLKRQGLEGVVASEIFGRSWDEVGGRFEDIANNFERVRDEIEKLDTTSQKTIDTAKRQERAVAELNLQLDRLKATAAKIITPTIEIVVKGLENPTVVNILKGILGAGNLPFTIALEAPSFGGGATPAAPTTQPGRQGQGLLELPDFFPQQQQPRGSIQAQIAAKEIEQNIARQALDSAKKSFEITKQVLDQLTKKGVTQDEIAAAQESFNKSQEKLQKAVEEENRIQEEISKLKRSGKEALREEQIQLDQELEDIKQKQRDLIPGSEAAVQNTEAAIAKLRQRIAELQRRPEAIGVSTSDEAKEILRRTKEINELQNAAEKDFNRQQSINFKDRIQQRRAFFDEALAQTEASVTKDKALLEKLFRRGAIDLTQFAKDLATADIRVTNEAIRSHEVLLATIDKEIARVKDRQAVGGITPLDAAAQLKELQNEREREQKAITDAKRKGDSSLQKIDDQTTEQLVNNRKRLRELEIELQESTNDRKLQLLQIASKEAIGLEEKEIQERNRIQLEGVQARIDDAVNLFRDSRLIQTSVSAAIVDGITKVTGVDITLPEEVKNASAAAIQSVITFIRNQGIQASDELIGVLQSILQLKERQKDIQQQTDIEQQQEAINKQLRLLDIERARVDIRSQLLDIEQARVDFLSKEDLLSRPEIAERQLDIDRQRLEQLKAQIELLKQQGAIELRNRIQAAQRAGVNTDAGFLEQQLNDKPFVDLIKDFLSLQKESVALGLAIQLSGSFLGQLRQGLLDIIDVLRTAPEPFNKLANVVQGVKKILDAFLVGQAEQKTPGQEIADGAKRARDEIVAAAQDFRNIVTAQPGGPGAPGITVPSIGGGAGGDKKAVTDARTKTTRLLLDSAVQIIGGLASGSTGGVIAGLGGAAGNLVSAFSKNLKLFGAAAGPLIGGIAQVVGGVFDFIGGIFKAKIEKIANQIQSSLQEINKQFRNGSLTIGQTIQALRAQAETARAQLTHGKVGKKGGKQQAAQIESQINDQIEELRRQAKEIQDRFIQSLEDLRLSPELRSDAQAVREAFDKVKEFLRSFENQADALKHIGEAQEFLNLSLGELKNDAVNQLTDIIKKEQEAQREFEKQRLAIINQGRVQSIFSQAQDKLVQLFELEKKRADEQAKAKSDEQALERRIGALDQAFKKAADLIESMKDAFSSLNSGLQSVFGSGGSIGRGSGMFHDLAQRAISSIPTPTSGFAQAAVGGSFSVSIAAGSPQDAAVKVADAMEVRLRDLGLIARVSGSQQAPRPFR